MKSIFTKRNIRIYKFETRSFCTLTKDLERRLEAAEMRYTRRIMRISWTGKNSNEELMEMATNKRSLFKTVRKKKSTNPGHINRADGLEKQILSRKICGAKIKGRQCRKYTGSLNNFVGRKESPNNELIRKTDNRPFKTFQGQYLDLDLIDVVTLFHVHNGSLHIHFL